MSSLDGRRAWVLNLGAELELEAGARPYAPPARVLRAMAEARARLAAMLPERDVVLDRDPDDAARGLEGRAWCATPSALARLARAGARVPDAPTIEVLRRVNERGLAFALSHLEGATRCTDEAEVIAALARPGRWLLKRGLGFAGRGQRKIDGGPVSDADLAWIRASLRAGALYIEPRVAIELEVAVHGALAKDGSVERGAPTIQLVKDGAWQGSRRAEAGELADDELRALSESFDRVAAALHGAGYFGPFGVDAFRFRANEAARFHALGEVNARYTMAWGVGMGGFR